MQPIILPRPCGLALVLWPDGRADVMPADQAAELAEQIALAEHARFCREVASW